MTQDDLKKYLTYDEHTGLFRWNVSTNTRISVGDVAGSNNGKGYLKIRIKGKSYYAHRLVWLYMYGHFPDGLLDHIDRDGMNNTLCNLREVTVSQNLQNTTLRKDNKSGVKGVHQHKDKWRASICTDGKRIDLGEWDNIEDAEAVIAAARLELHGEFACLG